MIDPRRTRRRKGIRIDNRKLVTRHHVLSVSQMPPQIRVHDASAACPKSFTDNDGKNGCRKCEQLAARSSFDRECLLLVFHVSLLERGIVTRAQKFALPEYDCRLSCALRNRDDDAGK